MITGEKQDNIGYIQITTFSDEDVSVKFTEKLNELKESGMERLILDLRGNPGGYLDKCVEIASNFIPEGEMITYTIDKYDNKQVSLSQGGDAIGMPLLLLFRLLHQFELLFHRSYYLILRNQHTPLNSCKQYMDHLMQMPSLS